MYITLPIVKNKLLLSILEYSVSKDYVTGFYNRKYLYKYLDKNTQLFSDIKTTFMIVEIDGFRAVDEEFDYDIGDKILIKLGDILNKVISKEDLIVRLAGHELLIILTNTDEGRAKQIAQSIIG